MADGTRLVVPPDYHRPGTEPPLTASPRWNQVKEVFQAALERTPHERAVFLRSTCGDDAALHAEVESLLVAHDQAGSFAAQPAILSLDGFNQLESEDHLLHAGDRLGLYEVT